MSAQAKAPDSELRAAFQFWHENERNYSKTAVEFKRDRKTIWRWANMHEWVPRANKIQSDVSKGIDRKITKEILSNVKMAEACLKKEVAAYLKPERVARGNVRDIVALLTYIDKVNGPNELAEAIKAAAKLDDLPYDPEMAAEVVDLLTDILDAQKVRNNADASD